MANKPTRNRNQTIHCDVCGEDYAATYKRCPFCEDQPAQNGEKSSGRRPRRSNNRGGGYSTPPTPARIIRTVLSLALIVAAVCIVVSIVKPLVSPGEAEVTPSTAPSETPAAVSESPEVSAEPTIPPDQTATGLTLDQSDFTLQSYGQKVTIHATFSPDGSKGYVTWSSSNPEVVSVDENGIVTAIGKSGGVSSATITATLTGTQISQSCIVRCSFDAPAGATTPGASSSPAPSDSGNTSTGALSLNREDFTLNATWPTFQMEVSGTTSTPTWSIANTAIATVDSTGKVTRVGIGTTTLTCTVDGQTLTCIVRCN